MCDKCKFPEGITIKPDGVHMLDPCIYQEVVRYRNVTVVVSRCKNCGHIDVGWMRQENTESVTPEEHK